MSAESATPVGIPEPQGVGEDPLYHYTAVYLLFLQGLFRQFATGSYKWSPSEDESEITITDQSPFPRDRIEHRPAIVTMRGPEQFGNLSLDNVRKVNHQTGEKERTDLCACTMSLCCIARQGIEAQRIAWIVKSNLRNFKELLQREGRIHKIGDEISLGPETPPGAVMTPESDSDAVMVVVQSPFFFQWTVKTTPTDRPLVREIETHIRASLFPEDVVARQIRMRPPTINGVVIPPHLLTQTVKI